MNTSASWVVRFAVGVALLLLATSGRPAELTAVGLALIAGGLSLASPRNVRRRSTALALGLAILAILSVAPSIAARL